MGGRGTKSVRSSDAYPPVRRRAGTEDGRGCGRFGTGSACVPDAEEPPAGYARYPEGKVPQQVDDKWDVYWDTHTLDKDGNTVAAPDAA